MTIGAGNGAYLSSLNVTSDSFAFSQQIWDANDLRRIRGIYIYNPSAAAVVGLSDMDGNNEFYTAYVLGSSYYNPIWSAEGFKPTNGLSVQVSIPGVTVVLFYD